MTEETSNFESFLPFGLFLSYFLILASNKSAICHEILSALQTVIKLFPGLYSSSFNEQSNNNDNINNSNANKSKTKPNTDEYSLIVSNITEVGLLNNLAKTNTILVHPDGDVSLSKFGYYEQGKSETSAGVSLFCDASDGIREGFYRGTGVSQVKIERPVALFNMFIASTGTKLAYMLQRFYERHEQDGVYGRVFFSWCPTVTDLPTPTLTRFTNIASFSHFSYATAAFFQRHFEFRYDACKADIEALDIDGQITFFLTISFDCFLGTDIEIEERLLLELQKQNVTSPPTYSSILNENDIHHTNGDNTNDSNEQMSSFKLFKSLLVDWWKSSNTVEDHLQPMHRKVISLFSKSIWSFKIIRILFRLMGNNLATINQKQCDRSLGNSCPISTEFQRSIETSIQDYLITECEKAENGQNWNWLMWSTHDDILAGYNWFIRKMLIVDTLLSLKFLPDVVAERTGRVETFK